MDDVQQALTSCQAVEMIRRCSALRVVPTRRSKCAPLRTRIDLDRRAPDAHSLSTAAFQHAQPTPTKATHKFPISYVPTIRRPRPRTSAWRGLSSSLPNEGAHISSPESSASSPSPPSALSLDDPVDRAGLLLSFFPESLQVNPWDAEASASWIPTLEARVHDRRHMHRQERLHPTAGASISVSGPFADAEEVAQQVEELDCVSRYVIQLLQELYLNQRPLSFDRVTTKRCLVVLNQLLRFGAGREGRHASGDPGLVLAGRAERARAILTCMQRFEETRDVANETRFSLSSSRQDDAQRIGRRRPYHAPLPTRDVYQTVLKIYADSGAPQYAYETVRHMANMYSRHGSVELKPSGFHWNCVLLAWENASSQVATPDRSDADQPSSWDKSVPAAKTFLENLSHMDDSCYKTMMRICRQGQANEKAAELGGSVAVKIWQETIEREGLKDDHPVASSGEGVDANFAGKSRVPDLSSHFYAFFFQAIRGLPLSSPVRDAYYGAGFQRALEKGKVNAVLVNEFIVHNTSAPLYHKFIRPYFDKSWKPLKPANAARKILDRMPASWHDRADGNAT
jgi:hypothetical protein